MLGVVSQLQSRIGEILEYGRCHDGGIQCPHGRMDLVHILSTSSQSCQLFNFSCFLAFQLEYGDHSYHSHGYQASVAVSALFPTIPDSLSCCCTEAPVFSIAFQHSFSDKGETTAARRPDLTQLDPWSLQFPRLLRDTGCAKQKYKGLQIHKANIDQ